MSMPSLKKGLITVLFGALVLLGFPHGTQAATSSFSALRVTTTGGGVISLAPGETRNIAVTFQNNGTETWVNTGAGYISLYTYGPKYRTSVFQSTNWISASQVVKLSESTVKPGGIGTLLFALTAPKTTGSYQETFNLAAEDKAWVTGGQFALNISVTTATKAPTPISVKTPTDTGASAASPSSGYSAQVVAQSATKMKVVAKKPVSFTAVIKNTGTKTWKSLGLSSAAMNIAAGSSSDFRHNTWQGTQVALLSQTVKPGESGTLQFFFTAPAVNGTHKAKFQVTADGIDVPDVFIELPVEVTGGAREAINAPVTEDVDTTSYIDEPTIRVGVLIVDDETDNEVYITSKESAFDLTDTSGTALGSYPSGKKIRAAYEGGKYVYQDDTGLHTSRNPLRFVPKTANAVMTVTNFDRRVTRNAANTDNTFRNILELRYNDSKDRTWLINELPMEYYLRGLGETSNVSPLEFQKALLTAARTYAFYHWSRATKHAAEGFHVDAYSDQVYFGYGQEARTPNITAGVEATRGQIVTYNGDTAITAYFSRSDGRTRDWSEVWGGNVPWSKSVPVPCDVGKKLWGHGVGMSASGALCMANDGKNWDEILKYFYTGIEIMKRWK